MKKNDVFQVIKNDDRFTILSAILDSTGIGEAMSNEPTGFTFFAPTDTAFERMSQDARILLTSPEGSALVGAILAQHLVPNHYLYSNDLRKRKSVKTLHGNEIVISKQSNIVRVGEANVMLPAIASTNAMVFPVDKVLPTKRRSRTRASA